MVRTKISAIAVLWNPIAVVTTTFLPVTMLGLPVACAMVLPRASPSAILRYVAYIDADCDSIPRIAPVVQIISVPGVVDINVVVRVPVVRPIFRPWVNNVEIKTAVLEAGISADHHHGIAVDAERVRWSKISSVTLLRNPVAVISAALLPIAVFGLPVVRATVLPGAPLCGLLSVLLLLGLHLRLLRVGLRR